MLAALCNSPSCGVQSVTVLLVCRYAGQEMDTEFIQVLQQQCKKYIEERGQATVPELHNFIQSAVSATH